MSISVVPSRTATADNPGSNWYATPVSISTTEYLWEIQSQWRGDFRLNVWSAPVRISGPAGKDGDPAPRFLGGFNSPPPYGVNDPRIGQITANHEDYFMFNSASAGGFTQNRIYQWDANQGRWNMLSVPTASNREAATKYWEALPQMTAGTMEQVISTAFINSLIANTAFIKELFSQYITILAGGYIQSETLTNGQRDFIIKSNGEVIFNKATIRGHVEANSGNITRISAQDISITGGKIEIGPLFVSDDMTPNSQDRSWAANTSFNTFVTALVPNIASMSIGSAITVPVYYGGTYGTAAYNLSAIIITIYGTPGGRQYQIEFIRDTGFRTTVNSDSSSSIGHPVFIRGGGAGKTFRLTGVPSSGNGQSGTLWRDPDQGNVLKIVP